MTIETDWQALMAFRHRDLSISYDHNSTSVRIQFWNQTVRRFDTLGWVFVAGLMMLSLYTLLPAFRLERSPTDGLALILWLLMGGAMWPALGWYLWRLWRYDSVPSEITITPTHILYTAPPFYEYPQKTRTLPQQLFTATKTHILSPPIATNATVITAQLFLLFGPTRQIVAVHSNLEPIERLEHAFNISRRYVSHQHARKAGAGVAPVRDPSGDPIPTIIDRGL